jgi:hypothetical protein
VKGRDVTTVVVAGALANKPGNGGEAWVRMSWVEGLRRLGLDVWFVEELSSSAWAESDPAAPRRNADWFRFVIQSFGLAARAALLDTDTGEGIGLSAKEVDELAASADLLVNISGHLRSALLSRFRRRAYIDLDPGYTQIWHVQGAPLGVEDHDTHFTVGLNLGGAECSIPDSGVRWVPLVPPVVLADWQVRPGETLERFTTVGSWRGAFGSLTHDGVVYGLKAHEFRKFIDVPEHVDMPFELALDIHPGDNADRQTLAQRGWRLVDPAAVAGDPWAFRHYVESSGAEFSVAQGAYVQTCSGWVSDRTVRYLAAGRPALVQDTGTPEWLPKGEGLVTFRNREDAVEGARRLVSDYRAHREAARRLVEDHFDASKVLSRFLDVACGR